MKGIAKFFLIFLILFFSFTMISGKEFKVAVAQLPTTELYSNLLKAIAEETNNTFNIEVVPFARLLNLVETGQVDMGGPIISLNNQKKQVQLEYDVSTAGILEMVFVLYSNKDKVINVDELKKGNPKKLNIETDFAHVHLFDFTCNPSTNIDGSLKKVDSGMIDGFIFAQGSTDMVLKKSGYQNIKRIYFDTFTLRFAIKKGTNGGEIDNILTAGMKKIISNGKYEKIIGAYAKKAKTFDSSF